MSQCKHVWTVNNGVGGEPKYRERKDVSTTELVVLCRCNKCGASTYLTKSQVEAMSGEVAVSEDTIDEEGEGTEGEGTEGEGTEGEGTEGEDPDAEEVKDGGTEVVDGEFSGEEDLEMTAEAVDEKETAEAVDGKKKKSKKK